MGAAKIVGGVLGVVGSAQKASAQRKQVEAANKQQKRQIENEKEQLAIQREQIYEQQVLSQMNADKQKAFADYQAQMTQLQRESSFAANSAALTAQGLQEQLQARDALFANSQQDIVNKLQTQKAATDNKAGLLNTFGDASQAGLDIDTQKYNQLSQVNEATSKAQQGRYGALVNQSKTEGELAARAEQTYNELVQAATDSGKKLTNGERKRLMLTSLLASQGVSDDSLTTQALNNSITTETNNESANTQQRMQQVDDATLMMQISQGALANVAAQIGIQEADVMQRKAVENGLLTEAQAAAKHSELFRKLELARQSYESKGNEINTQQLLNDIVSAQNIRDTESTRQQNSAARETALAAMNSTQLLDSKTDTINRLASDAGFYINANSSATQANSQLNALDAQKKALVYTPQKAPSVMGAIGGGLLNAGLNYYTQTEQDKLDKRNYNIQTGNVDIGRTYLAQPINIFGEQLPSYTTDSPLSVNNTLRIPSLLGGN